MDGDRQTGRSEPAREERRVVPSADRDRLLCERTTFGGTAMSRPGAWPRLDPRLTGRSDAPSRVQRTVVTDARTTAHRHLSEVTHPPDDEGRDNRR